MNALTNRAINNSPKPKRGEKSTIKPQKNLTQGTQLSYNKTCFGIFPCNNIRLDFMWR
jgi:hypothetical protein